MNGWGAGRWAGRWARRGWGEGPAGGGKGGGGRGRLVTESVAGARFIVLAVCLAAYRACLSLATTLARPGCLSGDGATVAFNDLAAEGRSDMLVWRARWLDLAMVS